MSKEEFKKFAKVHPELIEYIKNGEMTWQKFYEIYDIYGEDKEAWKTYSQKNTNLPNGIQDIISGISAESIKKHIDTAQKAISVVQELTSKSKDQVVKNVGKIVSPRPINKIFED